MLCPSVRQQCYSEFAGHTLSVDGGDEIYLDVEWLSQVLKPIMSHKLLASVLPQELSAMRDELVHDGVLRWHFARHLWSQLLEGVSSSSATARCMQGLAKVLITLGVALPLEPTTSSASVERQSHVNDEPNSPKDMLVIMRLPDRCSDKIAQDLTGWGNKTRPGERMVTLKWRFDPRGPPFGLVERVIAACHAVGFVERGLCWRYGALFKSRAMTNKGGRKYRLYTFIIRYDNISELLTMSMKGPLENNRVWIALRFVASAMVNILKDWPGVLSEGWPACVEHPDTRMYLASSHEVRTY